MTAERFIQPTGTPVSATPAEAGQHTALGTTRPGLARRRGERPAEPYGPAVTSDTGLSWTAFIGPAVGAALLTLAGTVLLHYLGRRREDKLRFIAEKRQMYVDTLKGFRFLDGLLNKQASGLSTDRQQSDEQLELFDRTMSLLRLLAPEPIQDACKVAWHAKLQQRADASDLNGSLVKLMRADLGIKD